MAVEIVHGDLLEQDVEAIVNAWNRNTIPWWLLLPQGVSGAIKKRGGTAPFVELKRHGRLRLGQAVRTGAGTLPFKHIIHVAGINDLWRATESSVRDSTRNALELATELGLASIAFPILGTGSGGMKQMEAERIMLEEAAPFESKLHIVLVRFSRP